MQSTFVALVAAVSLAVAGCSDEGGGPAEPISARSTQPGPVPAGTNCSREPLPFRATYLPSGWKRDLQIGDLKDYKEDGSFTSEVSKTWTGPAKQAIRVFRDPPGIESPVDPETIAVLGGRGEIGDYPLMEWHQDQGTSVISAAFSWCGSRWALVGTEGASLDDVRKVAEGFVPLDGKAS